MRTRQDLQLNFPGVAMRAAMLAPVTAQVPSPSAQPSSPTDLDEIAPTGSRTKPAGAAMGLPIAIIQKVQTRHVTAVRHRLRLPNITGYGSEIALAARGIHT